MANVIYAPQPYTINRNICIFLAGSIEMGVAENWQDKVIAKFSDIECVDFLNPRRTDWDSSWVQSIDNPQFNEQVNWELDKLALADYVFMYLQPGTISPISLLEFGMCVQDKTMIVVCPDGFHRKGNVDIVCERERVEYLYTDLDSGINRLLDIIQGYIKMINTLKKATK